MRRAALLNLALAAGFLLATAWGSDIFPGMKAPTVHFAPAAPVRISPGRSGKVELAFRVEPDFHINSNKPKSNLLVPTVVRFSPPTDILVGKISYPPGQDLTFDFMPTEKLNVYTGDFSVRALVSASHSIPTGTYRVHGTLKYQACDNRQCYSPRETKLAFDVVITKVKAQKQRVRRNPAQSPHVHN